jgi:hypothetical protein
MSSIYHILDKIPAIHPEDMLLEYEELAQQLIKSGKLRIDTDDHCNFARFSDPDLDISLMVSKEELSDPLLIEETKKLFRSLYEQRFAAETDKKIATIFDSLKKQINKLQPVDPETTIILARVFVQSAHPIVIKWLLYDKVEVFITYSHNIGDMMDINSWKHSGSNSGMQSTDGKNVAIFVSCGGNPFLGTSREHPTYGDGWPAIARLQIIAAQELGHFSDIKRDEMGRQISSRHSANFSGTRATGHVKQARKQDLQNCNKLLTALLAAGMDKMINYEEQIKFYHDNKVTGFKVLWIKILHFIYKQKILLYAKNHKLFFIKRFSRDKYMSLMIRAMIDDMKFNLSPIADVYKRSDKEAEEAIACIEALARVPQQVMKWGYITTMATMEGLFKVYYQEVIPSLIKNYTIMTNRIYTRNYNKTPKNFFYFLSKANIFANKKQEITPVRDI